VHDLLSAIALARGWEKTRNVRIAGFAGAGPQALLAHALAGDASASAAIDLDGFDFDRVSGETDPMLLPGALKYGGIYGFAPLCAGRPTLLCNARKTGRFNLAERSKGVTLRGDGSAATLIESLVDSVAKSSIISR
ncbi:MAG: hypothetical protein ABIP55_05065, partial [Tepidisphaeraceae bacterium]